MGKAVKQAFATCAVLMLAMMGATLVSFSFISEIPASAVRVPSMWYRASAMGVGVTALAGCVGVLWLWSDQHHVSRSAKYMAVAWALGLLAVILPPHKHWLVSACAGLCLAAALTVAERGGKLDKP
jgi:predicted MFS family arabinose efflux permease